MRKATCIAVASAGLCLGSLSPERASAQPSEHCATSTSLDVICGDSAAEDLLAIPGTHWILASSFTGRGGLRLIEAPSRKVYTLTFGSGISEKLDRAAFPTCPSPVPAADKAKFITHGLALGRRSGTTLTLYVVHHGTRESIEAFTLDTSSVRPSLTWTGCVVAPATVGLNSIAVLPGGDLVATNFLSRGSDQAAEFKRVLAGQANGELWEWNIRKGWRKIAGSEGSGLNGVEVSPDGRMLYLAAWGSRSLTRLPRQGVRDRLTVPLGFRVDNLRWMRDKRLMAAGQTESGSKVVAINPISGEVTELANIADTLSFGGASVGVENKDEIWIGSYGSLNIAVVKPPSG